MSFRHFWHQTLRMPHRRREKRSAIPEFVTTDDNTKPQGADKAEDFAKMDEIQLSRHNNRREASQGISEITQGLYSLASSHVDQQHLDRLGIVSETLVLGIYDARKYFYKPQFVSWVRSHPPDMGEPLVRQEVEAMQRVWLINDKESVAEESGADVLGSHLAIEFDQYERLPEGCGSLDMMSGWTEMGLDEGVLRSRFMTPRVFAAGEDSNPLAPWATEIVAAWARDPEMDDEKPLSPHIIVLLTHNHPPVNELLRTELLIALGVTRTRLGVFKEHEIGPVMLISCFNGTKARIIQAHYQTGQMIVFKSDIYAFNSPESREDNVPLFLAYFASEPAGNTRHMRPELEESD
ncbi:hypothetical protein BJX64DRAFT_289871 [Aspergillus heterothallicus]